MDVSMGKDINKSEVYIEHFYQNYESFKKIVFRICKNIDQGFAEEVFNKVLEHFSSNNFKILKKIWKQVLELKKEDNVKPEIILNRIIVRTTINKTIDELRKITCQKAVPKKIINFGEIYSEIYILLYHKRLSDNEIKKYFDTQKKKYDDIIIKKIPEIIDDIKDLTSEYSVEQTKQTDDLYIPQVLISFGKICQEIYKKICHKRLSPDEIIDHFNYTKSNYNSVIIKKIPSIIENIKDITKDCLERIDIYSCSDISIEIFVILDLIFNINISQLPENIQVNIKEKIYAFKKNLELSQEEILFLKFIYEKNFTKQHAGQVVFSFTGHNKAFRKHKKIMEKIKLALKKSDLYEDLMKKKFEESYFSTNLEYNRFQTTDFVLSI